MKKFYLAAALAAAIAPAILPSQFVPRENSATAAPGKVLLRLRLKAGQRYVTRFSSENTWLSTEKDGTPKSTLQRQHIKMTFVTRVLKVTPNGNMTIQIKITDTQVMMDSHYPHPDVPITKVFRAMIGIPLTVEKTPAGKTLRIRGTELMMRRMMAAMPSQDVRSRAQRQEAREVLRELFDFGKMQSFGQDFYPSQAVDTGKTWRANLAMGGNILVMKTTYRLTQRSKNVSIISATGSFKEPPSKVNFSDGSGAMTQTLTGAQTMQMQVDEKTGLPRLANGSVRVEEEQTITEGTVSRTSLLIGSSRIRMTISDR